MFCHTPPCEHATRQLMANKFVWHGLHKQVGLRVKACIPCHRRREDRVHHSCWLTWMWTCSPIQLAQPCPWGRPRQKRQPPPPSTPQLSPVSLPQRTRAGRATRRPQHYSLFFIFRFWGGGHVLTSCYIIMLSVDPLP